jgi:orotidine-5'-phosphate decarboxylase
MKIIRRVRQARLETPPDDGSPWVADVRTFDIPETVAAMIRNAAPGLVAVTLGTGGGIQMMVVAERAARRRNVRVLWLHRKQR